MKTLSKRRFQKKLESYEKVDQVIKDLSRYREFAEYKTKMRKDCSFDLNKIKKGLAEQLYKKEEVQKKEAFIRAYNKLTSMISYTVYLYGDSKDNREINVKLAKLYYQGRSARELKDMFRNINIQNIDLEDSHVLEDIAEKTKANSFKLETIGKVKRIEIVTKIITNKKR